MSLVSRILARVAKLPPADTYHIAVEKHLEVPMPDGVVLPADLYRPRHAERLPTLLVRTPYGRSGAGLVGRLFAERGFQALIQSCRGTDGSGGEVTPFRGEREDGLATLEWLKQQNWFDGRLVMAGASYLGFTQWAIARDAGPMLKAFSTHVTSAEFRSPMYPGESFQLEIFLQWVQITHARPRSLSQYLWKLVTANRRLSAATWHLPLSEADEMAVGEPMKCWREWLQHSEPGDAWWAVEDYRHRVQDVTAPNHLVSGWHDFLLVPLLRDYASLQQAGRKPYLTIGPWAHSSSALQWAALRESLLWLRAHVQGETKALRKSPARIYVMGTDEWRDLETWPPSTMQARRWYLQPEAGLSTDPPPSKPPSQFRYDPTDPTPNVGGAINTTLARGTGPQDNRTVEARPDVLVFTSPPLPRETEVIGPVSAELYVSSSLHHTDFFVRLLDVTSSGTSMNICDGLVRVAPSRPAPMADGVTRTQHNTSMVDGFTREVTITDATHPLFGQTLPLLPLQIHRNKTHVTVVLPTGRRRSVPRQATSLENPPDSSPVSANLLPISVRTILPLARFVAVLQRAKEESHAPIIDQPVPTPPLVVSSTTENPVEPVVSYIPAAAGETGSRVTPTRSAVDADRRRNP